MKGKLLGFIFILLAVMSGVTVGYAEADIHLGEYIQMGSYAGRPILWRCVEIDENGALILADKIICLKPFDAAGGNTNGSHGRGSISSQRISAGSNYWGDSNIRCWLNSASAAGEVEWKCQNPPVAKNISLNLNAYSNEAGFLSNFTPMELGAIKTVTQKTLLDGYEYDPENKNGNTHEFNSYTPLILTNYDSAYSEPVTDRMFLLDVRQVSAVYHHFGDYYIAEISQQCVDSSASVSALFQPGSKWKYWLRTPKCDTGLGHAVRTVQHDGADDWAPAGTVRTFIYGGHVDGEDANKSYCGVRPAFYLDAENALFTSGDGSEENPFIVSSLEISPLVSDWAVPVISEYKSKYGIAELDIGDYRQNITREKFCDLAYHTLKNEKKEMDSMAILPFTDTNSDSVRALYGAGIIKGRSASAFMPNDNITREEAAVILYRLVEYMQKKIPEPKYGAQYTDEKKISAWAKTAVKAMKDMGIMTGVSVDEFMPEGVFTAEQAVTTMLRVFQ